MIPNLAPTEFFPSIPSIGSKQLLHVTPGLYAMRRQMTMVALGKLTMKTMPAGVFKTNCLAVMEEVKTKRETVVITKHGKPVAMLVPVKTSVDDIFGFLRNRGRITGDVVSPVLSADEWGELG